MVVFAQAAERHPIFQGERDIASMEAEMKTIRLPPPPGPPMLALDAEMAPPPPQQRPVDRKGKAPVRTAPRPQPARLHNAVNQALTTAHAKVAVLSSGPAYDGYSLTTSQVTNVKDLEIICGAVAPLLPTGLQYFFFFLNRKFILRCSIAVRMPDTQRYKALLPTSRCY